MKYLAMVGMTLLMITQSAIADQGDWLVRVGAHNVDPKSDNSDIVEVDSAIMVTFNGTYMFQKNWGVELLAALPFSHDIDLVGGGKVAKTKHLPPTASIQYHFAPDSNIRPYVGAGLNWTLFFDESTTGALDGTDLNLGNSFGFAAQAGVDIDVNERWFVNADVRYMDIETKAKLDGVSLGKVEIDPWLFGVSLGFRL